MRQLIRLMVVTSMLLLPAAPVTWATDYTFSAINVPFAGATGTFAFGINGTGQSVGLYGDASGAHGFLATPVPEPASLFLVASGLAGLGLLRHRHRGR